MKVTFSRAVHGGTGGNVALRLASGGSNLAGSLTCRDAASPTVSCSTGAVRSATLDLTPNLIAGQRYTVLVAPTGLGPSPMTAQRPWLRPTETFRASLVEDDNSVGARYVSPRTAWERKRALAAYGDANTHADLDGAVAEFKFRGTGIDWYTVLGPSMGKAAVYVDGALELTVDTYASRVTYGAKRSVRGLSDGVHTIKVVTLGKRRSASIGTTIAVDRWVVL